MFSNRGLFSRTPCPLGDDCKHVTCLFSHQNSLNERYTLNIPVVAAAIPSSNSKANPEPPSESSNVPAKRPDSSHPELLRKRPLSATGSSEPPRKIQRLSTSRLATQPKPTDVLSGGVPTLKVVPAQSQVPVPVRQTMLKTLYEHYAVLYHEILSLNPTLASEHALKQEQECYAKSSKQTYRNTVIQCAASLKRRPIPDKVTHPSVGTVADLAARAEAQNSIKSLRLAQKHLEPLMHSVEELQKWGYVMEAPEGPGGDRPSHTGSIATCERCKESFMVRKDSVNTSECTYHWGRPQVTRVSGERTRVFDCCFKPEGEGGGCSQGRHVFYETDPKDLHARHSFSTLQPAEPGSSKHHTVVALDCEMIYTTGGMRVARVSCVDGGGKTILDEFVKMDEGVDVIDYNTRFSGITPENLDKAVLTLDSVRQALDNLINEETILIGHALDNDLKTLRIVHRRCVDTAILFARNGYRRALRHLVRQHLGVLIQTGGATEGHSSVEDSIATLDLLRWHVLDKAGRMS